MMVLYKMYANFRGTFGLEVIQLKLQDVRFWKFTLLGGGILRATCRSSLHFVMWVGLIS